MTISICSVADVCQPARVAALVPISVFAMYPSVSHRVLNNNLV